MSNRKSNLSVQYMTRIAILGALSAILFMIEIPVVAFYKLDVSTLPALLANRTDIHLLTDRPELLDAFPTNPMFLVEDF